METALALISRPTASLGKPTRKDRDIWLMKKRGWADDQLATRFNIGVDKIRLAIDRWELYRASFENGEVDLSINQMAMGLLPRAQKVLEDGMKATKSEERFTRGKRRIVTGVADHATRIKTLDSFKSLLEAVRPKGVGVQVNTQINNPAKETGPTVPKGFDFESRLRMIRAEKGLSNDDMIEEGEFVDEAEDNVEAVRQELADQGIEMPEDDEDEE